MADDPKPPEGGEPNDDPPPAKTFTQDEVDRIVGDRLARAKSKVPDDYDDLKAKAAQFDEIDAANKSDLEKAIARAEKAEAEATSERERARAADVRSAVTAAASAAGAVDIDAVCALLPTDAVTVGDDGQVTGAEQAVTALLESKPYLVGQAPPASKPEPSADGGPRGTSGDGVRQLNRADLSTMSPEQILEAESNGQLADLYAGT